MAAPEKGQLWGTEYRGAARLIMAIDSDQVQTFGVGAGGFVEETLDMKTFLAGFPVLLWAGAQPAVA
jgi:hypothetical protein